MNKTEIKKEELINYENILIIAADKTKGGTYFHIDWKAEEYDIIKIMSYLIQKLSGEVGE